MGQGLRLALVGVGLGLCLAIALTGLLRSLLYGVSAHDPVTFISVTVFLVGVAAIASFLPARRAMKIAPMEASATSSGTFVAQTVGQRFSRVASGQFTGTICDVTRVSIRLRTDNKPSLAISCSSLLFSRTKPKPFSPLRFFREKPVQQWGIPMDSFAPSTSSSTSREVPMAF